MRYKLCKECGQPLKPKGVKKKPFEYDHATGCPKAPKRKPGARTEQPPQ